MSVQDEVSLEAEHREEMITIPLRNLLEIQGIAQSAKTPNVKYSGEEIEMLRAAYEARGKALSEIDMVAHNSVAVWQHI